MGIALFSSLDREMLAGVKGVDRYSLFFFFSLSLFSFPFLLLLFSWGSSIEINVPTCIANWINWIHITHTPVFHIRSADGRGPSLHPSAVLLCGCL
jgi:hypothetical protein